MVTSTPAVNIAIVGSGHFAQTLAWLWGQSNTVANIYLWGRNTDLIQTLKNTNTLSVSPEHQFSNNTMFVEQLNQLPFADIDIVVLAVSASATHSICQQLTGLNLNANTKLVLVSKGIGLPALKRQSQLVTEVFPEHDIAVFSGPTLSKELLAGQPTAACIASSNLQIAETLMKELSVSPKLRLYATTDITGVELGGALKNCYAIGSGYLHYHQLGDNTLAAFTTRCLAELSRLAFKLGAKPETLYGLSGLGDLLATCNSPLSRNYQLGMLLAQNIKLDEALAQLPGTAEGAKTTPAICQLAKDLQLDLPIAQLINQLLLAPQDPKQLIQQLMQRELKTEQLSYARVAE